MTEINGQLRQLNDMILVKETPQGVEKAGTKELQKKGSYS